MSTTVLAITGLPGSGKSEATKFFKDKAYPVLRFGDAVEEEIKNQNLPLTEENEHKVRTELREKYGMHAMASLLIPRLEAAMAEHKIIVRDGMKSYEEYVFLTKSEFKIVTVAVLCEKKLRYERLATRAYRPLTIQEAEHRDINEVMDLHIGPTIALADFYVLNTTTIDQLHAQLTSILTTI